MSKDRICEFECNIDDMTAEEIAFACEMLMAGGAKDVQTRPIVMKKGRPGTLLTVMCAGDEAERERMIRLIFKYTTTIGIREVISERYILERSEEICETPYGPVRFKKVSGYGTERRKAEYEDVAKIARANGISFADALKLVEDALK